MRKHYKTHTQPEVEAYERAINNSLQDDDQGSKPLKGQRVPMACAGCAKTKTKCDQQIPCGRCKAKGITCTPRAKRRTGAVMDSPGSTSLIDLVDEEALSDEAPSPGRAVTDVESGCRMSLDGEGSVVLGATIERSPPGELPTPNSASSAAINRVLGPAMDATNQASARDDVRINPTPQPHAHSHPVSSTPISYGDTTMDQFFDMPLLPQLDWQSLANTPGPSQFRYHELPFSGTQEHTSAIDKSDWTDSVGQTGSSALDQVGLGNEGLFLFNYEEFSWQSRLSALDSMMPESIRLSDAIPHGSNHRLSGSVTLDDAIQKPSPTYSLDSSQPDSRSASDIVMTGEDLDKWPISQCTRPDDSAFADPDSREALAGLGAEDMTNWSHAVERYRDSCYEAHERIENVDLTDETRDRMLLAAQNFLRAGMDFKDGKAPPNASFTKQPSLESVLLLPPKTSLQKYLDIFLTTFEPFTPMIPAISLDPNKLVGQNSEREATLLLFLMIAFGSMIDPAPRARRFSHELTEVCRYSLVRVTEMGRVTKRDVMAMHCALIFTVQTSFSGRLAHMELGSTQRHMHLSVRCGLSSSSTCANDLR